MLLNMQDGSRIQPVGSQLQPKIAVYNRIAAGYNWIAAGYSQTWRDISTFNHSLLLQCFYLILNWRHLFLLAAAKDRASHLAVAETMG